MCESTPRYRVGRGEPGVLSVELDTAELLPRWRICTPAIAQVSAARLYERFLAYKAAGDIVGMDMARKFLQMGFTRMALRPLNRSAMRLCGLTPQRGGGLLSDRR